MLEFLELDNIGPTRHAALRFAPRLNLLTGDNGLGKTFLLEVAWRVLTGGWNGYMAWRDPRQEGKAKINYKLRQGEKKKSLYYDFETQSWSTFNTGHPRPDQRPWQPPSGLVIYVLADGGVSVWDSARVRHALASRSEHPLLADATYQFTQDTLWNGLPRDNGTPPACEGLLRDWVLWQVTEESPFAALCSVLKTLSPPDGDIQPAAPMDVFLADPRKSPTLKMPYGTVPILFAAAGLRRILSLAYVLVWSWVEHNRVSRLLRRKPTNQLVLLYDEVEAHLHPQWQRALLPALFSAITVLDPRIDVQIIAATHSPLVLASVETFFEEDKDQLFAVRLDETGQSVAIDETPFAKLGDVSEWLTSDIFGLKEARSREAEEVIGYARAFMLGDKKALPEGFRTKESIHGELLRTLPPDDPFWPRWIVRQMEKRG